MIFAAGGHSPIEQFALKKIIPLKLFGFDASITNSTLFMIVTVLLICGFLYYAMQGASRVPGRLLPKASQAGSGLTVLTATRRLAFHQTSG